MVSMAVLPVQYGMALAEEPDHVHGVGDPDPGKEADDEPDEQGAELPVQVDPPDGENDSLS